MACLQNIIQHSSLLGVVNNTSMALLSTLYSNYCLSCNTSHARLGDFHKKQYYYRTSQKRYLLYLLIILRTKKQSFIPFYSPENCYVKYRANLIWLKGVEIFTKQNGAIEIGNLNKLELFHIELLTETKKNTLKSCWPVGAIWGSSG